MGATYDCASILLCDEDNTSVLGFEDDVGEVQECNGVGKNYGCQKRTYNGTLVNFFGEFPVLSDEFLEVLVAKEVEHLPCDDYSARLLTSGLDLSIRKDAIDWICKVHRHYGFGPLSAYLSVNYLDRFLSAYELPQDKAWMTQLLSVACLSLGAKIEETEVPLSLDLQIGEAKYVFEARTIQRMELLVLSTLKWRMQAVTPFSFIDYFLHKFSGGNSPPTSILAMAMEFILSTIRGVEFLAFRPSEIAAAVARSVLGESQFLAVDKALTSCKYVRKDRVLKCYKLIHDVILMRNNRVIKDESPSTSSVPQSPVGVLDAACRSCKSDEISVNSQVNTVHTSSPTKKKKLVS